jgi:hypothetical protein
MKLLPPISENESAHFFKYSGNEAELFFWNFYKKFAAIKFKNNAL